MNCAEGRLDRYSGQLINIVRILNVSRIYSCFPLWPVLPEKRNIGPTLIVPQQDVSGRVSDAKQERRGRKLGRVLPVNYGEMSRRAATYFRGLSLMIATWHVHSPLSVALPQ